MNIEQRNKQYLKKWVKKYFSFILPIIRSGYRMMVAIRKNFIFTFPIRKISEQESTTRQITFVLNNCYGHWRTVETGESISKDGNPIPWYTFPAIEYLDQIDFKDKTVFEWGSGNSSLYWAKATKSLTSVEDDPLWYRKIERNMRGNFKILLIEDKNEYINSIKLFAQKYDVIVIDGSYRYECSFIAPQYLEKGGLIILDNSDWLPKSANLLRDANLLEVDMHGFGPIAKYTFTTSLFFDRDFAMITRISSQPRPSMGSSPVPEHFLSQEPR